MSNPLAVNNLRQYIDFINSRTTLLTQHVYSLTMEVNKLKKIVTKLKNGEEVDDDEDETSTTRVPTAGAPQMAPRMAPQMGGMPQFNQMPQLQTLNLNTGSYTIDN